MKFVTFKYSLLLILFSILISSCSSSHINYSNPAELGMAANLSYEPEQHKFIIDLSAPDKLIKNTQNVFLVIKTKAKKDTVFFKNLELTDISSSTNKLKASAVWNDYRNFLNSKTINDSTSKIDLIIILNEHSNELQYEKSDNKYYKETYLLKEIIKESAEKEDSTALTFESKVNVFYDSLAVFSLKATRNKLVKSEYIPNSETFRVEIYNNKGELEWSSGNRANFLQVIKKVEPVNVGNSHVYSMKWFGRNSEQMPLPEGNYTVKMTIPAKPMPYVVFSKFSWKK